MILSSSFHLPVLLPEIVSYLRVKRGKKYIDATLGGGGHSFEILRLGGIVLGIDVDQDAIEYIKKKLGIGNWELGINKRIFIEQGNFADLLDIAKKHGFNQVDGILFDLGMSSYQLDLSGRGFSYLKEELLDMRMDKNRERRAVDIVNLASEEELYEIFTKYAEELHSRDVASAIVCSRALESIKTTRDLIKIIKTALRNDNLSNRVYARIFQALRIAVNEELEVLKKGLKQGWELLSEGGRLLVISYHSLEDRLVKAFYKRNEDLGFLKIVNKKPIKASLFERNRNPRARSAKLRIAEKIWR